MRVLHSPKMLLKFWLLIMAAVSVLGIFSAAQAQSVVTGVLSVIYGDNPDAPQILYILNTPDGREIPLQVSPDVLADAGGITALMGATVTVALDGTIPAVIVPDVTLPARDIAITSPQATSDGSANSIIADPDVTGSLSWLNLLCKFSDVSASVFSTADVTGFFANTSPMLDHYWRQSSYDLITIPSVTTTAWKTLPRTRAQYLALGNSMLSTLFDECTALHASTVTFSAHYGMNLFFNDQLSGYYWGTSCSYKTLQGSTQCWRNTWLPYYGFADIRAYGHEMGHAFGLPHSNNSDGDGNPYDNFYDIMSGFPCLNYSNEYRCQQAHTIAAHKEALGWINPANAFNLSANGTYPITLDRLAKSTTSSYYYAYIDFTATHGVTMEARRNDAEFGVYDNTLFNSGVVLFDILSGRGEPAWQINAVTDGASIEGPGIFLPGETYTDYVNGWSMRVDSQTADGYGVTLYKGALGSSPDLALSVQSVSNGTGKSTVNLRVQNNGSGMATNAYIAFDLVNNIFINTITATPQCEMLDEWVVSSYLCSLGDLAPGAIVDIPVDVRPSVSSSINVPFAVVSNELETNTANNTISATIGPVTPLGDLVIDLSANRISAPTSAPIVYTAALYNIGGVNATGVNYTFNVPAGMTISSIGWGWSGTISGLSCGTTTSQATCTISTLGSASNGTHLDLNIYAYATLNGAKTVNANVSSSSAEASTANNPQSLMTLIGSAATVNGTVTFPGRPGAPSTQLVEDFDLDVTHVSSGNKIIDSTVTSNTNGTFTVTGLTTVESFKFRIKLANALSVVRTTPLDPTTNINFGTLIFGDANNDNTVTIADFSILASTFGKSSADIGYDARADFNGDNAITIADFSLLAAGFGQAGMN